ncbi:FG-GAP-like repeat-containing protein [Rhodocaloribacter sp.]
MPTLRNHCLLALLLLWAVAPADGLSQWIDFQDETAARLSLSTVTLNDDQEKDVGVSDFNQDGWDDVVVVRKEPFSTPGARTDVLLLNENGTLVDRTAEYAPGFLATPTDARDVFVGDFDGDGWDDLVIANTFAGQPRLYRNLGNDGNGDWLGLADESDLRLPLITVAPLQFCAVWAGDIDGDGSLDLYFANYKEFGTAFDVLLMNDGAGFFTDETLARLGDLRNSGFGTSVEIHDMDNDGDQDILKTSTLNSVPPWNAIGNFLLFNDGTGHFTNWEKIPGTSPYMFTTGDLNDDALMDVYVVDDAQDYVDLAVNVIPDTQVQFQKNTLTDSPRTTSFGGNVKLADLDNDGDLDLAIADVDVDIPTCSTGGTSRRFTMLENAALHSGSLADPWGSQDNPWNVSTFDFGVLDIDRDGNLDLFLGGCQGYAVFMQTTGAPDVVITLTPESNDIVIPPGGGSFTYDLNVVNNSGVSQTVDIWLVLDGPGGINRTLAQVSKTLPAGGNITRTFTQTIPGGAPAGDYTFTGNVGTFPTADQSDGFPFSKAAGAAPVAVRGWGSDLGALSAKAETATTRLDAAVAGAGLPAAYALDQNYPNPFNPSTSIVFALPEAGRVSLRVFNLLGQEVATLADGFREAGRYRVSFDASELSAGLYLYVLETADFKATRRMMLLK